MLPAAAAYCYSAVLLSPPLTAAAGCGKMSTYSLLVLCCYSVACSLQPCAPMQPPAIRPHPPITNITLARPPQNQKSGKVQLSGVSVRVTLVCLGPHTTGPKQSTEPIFFCTACSKQQQASRGSRAPQRAETSAETTTADPPTHSKQRKKAPLIGC